MLDYPVIPSLSQLAKRIYILLANHPLLINPLVYHPVDKIHVPISSWRLQGGFPIDDRLICSIFPASEADDAHSYAPPTSVATSVIYKPHNLGRNNDEAMYHFIISFTMREVSLEGFNLENSNIKNIPKESIISPDDYLLNSWETKQTELSLNPPFDIISNYLELARLVLIDRVHYDCYPLNPDYPGQSDCVEIIHQNYTTRQWDKDTNIVVHQGYLYIQVMTFISRGWRDKFIPLINRINIDYGREKDII